MSERAEGFRRAIVVVETLDTVDPGAFDRLAVVDCLRMARPL
jgi:hypothetical protein